MAELDISDLNEYAGRLADSEAEQQAMIEEVVVPESWFFRDERLFRWLADHVRAHWIASPGRPPLHALSLPCAGGQEPYSIAIALRDAGLPVNRFRIDAVDVSARLIEVVRRGVYSANSFRSPSALTEGWWRGTSAGIPRATRSTRPSARRSGSSGPMCSTLGCWRIRPLMKWYSAATS